MGNFDFVAIDFETATNNRMACQVGIVVVKDGEITERISRLIQPPLNSYDSGTNAVHHITPDDTADAPTFDQLWPEISKYFMGPILVAHNAVFDEDVLLRNLNFYNIDTKGIGRFICTCDLYRKKSLEDLCLAFSIPVNQHHDALFDAECCAIFYLNYHYGIRPDYSLIPVRGSYKQKALTGDILVKDLSHADPNNPFYDRKVVITGDFCYDRKELAQMLKKMGADINTTISKKTHFVLVGDKPGPAKIEKLEKLIHDGYNIRKIFQSDLLAILNGDYDSFKVEKNIVKDLDLTYNHFEMHHFDLKTLSISTKEIFLDKQIVKGRMYLKQMLGNLGAYANDELFPETNVCLLDDHTVDSLRSGVKNDTVLFIQDSYNKEKSIVFDFQFMSLSELLNFIKKRCLDVGDEITMSYYRQYMKYNS